MKNDRFYNFIHILKLFYLLLSNMDFSVLSPDFKKQLEQQLARLQKEREDIISQAAQFVDANIGHINALLGEAEVSEAPAKRVYNRKTSEEPEVRIKRPYNRKQPTPIGSESNSPKSKSTNSKVKQVKAPKSKPSLSDFPALKSDYASMTPAEAIVALLKAAPSQVFTVDEVIAGIYGAIDEAQMPKTRQRMGVTLGHCARRQECVKVDGEIAQYRFS
jgi:hypothetical protein